MTILTIGKFLTEVQFFRNIEPCSVSVADRISVTPIVVRYEFILYDISCSSSWMVSDSSSNIN